MSAQAVAEHHVVVFEKFGRREFIGRCSCSASSGPVPYAGMVHGWEAGHLEDVAAVVDPLTTPAALRSEAIGAQLTARDCSQYTREEYAAGERRILSDRRLAEWQVLDAGIYADARDAADRYREALSPP